MPDESPIENAADRLIAILKKLPDNGKGDFIGAWSKAFFTGDKSLDLIKGLLEVEQLVRELEIQLARVNLVHGENAKKTVANVRYLYSTLNFKEEWHYKTSALNNSILGVGLLADVLRAAGISERPIPPETLHKIREQIDALFKDVQSHELPESLRVFLLSLLEELRRGVSEYQIFGVGKFRDTLAVSAMRFATHPMGASAVKKQKDGDTFLTRFGNLFKSAKSAVDGVESAQGVIDWIQDKILPG